MSRFRNLISIANLEARRAKRKGQIATFLLLSIVGALIVTLMTANLGHLSLQATTASNAADSAALLLGSQLATKSNQLYIGLDNNVKKCVPTGILAAVLAVILAVIAVVVAIVSFGVAAPLALMAIGAAAGAIGGAVGGAIAGTGAVQGAITGFMIGAAIGSVASAFVAAPVAAPASGGAAGGTGGAAGGTELAGGSVFTAGEGGATVSGFGELAAGATVTIPEGGAMLTAGAGSIAPTIGVLAISQAALAIAAPIYNASVQSDMLADAVAEFAKALSGAPEHLRYQQSVIFQGLAQTVDDPNTSPDLPDVDGDGNTTEQMSDFALFWYQHVKDLKDNLPNYSDLAWNFVHGDFETFADFAQVQAGCVNGFGMPATCQAGGGWGGGFGGGLGVSIPGFLVSSDINYGAQTGGADGALEELVEGIEASGYYDFSWWESGPTWNAYHTWASDETCDTCPPPPGYDVVNALDDTLLSAASDWEELDGLSKKELGSTLDNWLVLFYDPFPDLNDPEATDLYHELQGFINGTPTDAGIIQWEAELQTLYANLPDCTFNYTSGFPYPTPTQVNNPPCRQLTKTYPSDPGVGFASSDADLADEFDPVIGSGQGLVNLRNGLQDFMNDLKAFADSVPFIFSGGMNPVIYEWDDSRGHHKVSGQTGPFKVPKLKKYKTGNFLKGKKCVKIVNGKKEGTGTSNGTWVKIRRDDPANVNAGVWTWNPHGGTVEKKSKSCFDVFHKQKADKKLYLCATDFPE